MAGRNGSTGMRTAQSPAIRRGYGRDLRRGVGQIGLMALLINAVLVLVQASATAQTSQRPVAIPVATDKIVKIVAFGDSLTAGYQLPPGDAFPAQLEKALRAKGHRVEVLNAGVSGDTTAAGLERFGWAVPSDADGVIVELGANDALRGLDPGQARSNLDKILAAIQAQKAAILIAGMRAPSNLPVDYVAKFDAIFPELAKKYDALLYPLFIERIAMKPQFNLADGLHPNAKGVGEIVNGILPHVEDLIARINLRRTAG